MKKIESFLNSKKGKIFAWTLILVLILLMTLVVGIVHIHKFKKESSDNLEKITLENSGEADEEETKIEKLSSDYYEINQEEKMISFQIEGIKRFALSDDPNGPTDSDKWHDITKEKTVEISDGEVMKKYVYYQAGGDTYLIRSKEEFLLFRDKVNGYKTFEGKTVVLMCDVDLSDQDCWVHIGTLTQPFKGTFDGNGHVISNLTITTAQDNIQEDYTGLFGYVNGGTIKNLTIQGGSIASGRCAGAFIGFLYNGTAENLCNESCAITRKEIGNRWHYCSCRRKFCNSKKVRK